MDIGCKRTSSETFSRLFFHPIFSPCFLFCSYQIAEVRGKYKERSAILRACFKDFLETFIRFREIFWLRGRKIVT